jgi:hypothetical protein
MSHTYWIDDKKVKKISFFYGGQRPAPRISRIHRILNTGAFLFAYTKQDMRVDKASGKVKFIARVWPGEYFEAENFDWAEDAKYQSVGRLGYFKVLPDLSIAKVDEAEVRANTPSIDAAEPIKPSARKLERMHQKGNWSALS